jgi:hypothetical protein
MNRRNILTILGLAAAGTPAMAAEQMDTLGTELLPPRVPGLMTRSEEAQKRIAAALEQMAAAIRAGELTGIKLEINSVVEFDNWIRHEVKVQCELSAPPAVCV